MSWLYLRGGGGGILGGKLVGFRTICAVEWEPYCQAILLARQADGLLEKFPIWDDVRSFDGVLWARKVDVITAGFPCQPFSTAGKRKGEDDERNMWPDTIRVIREVGPEWCLLENVPGLVSSGYFGTVLRDLAQAGFDAEWDVFSAAGEGAPHLRERLWIVAHSNAYPLRRNGGELEVDPAKAGVDAQCEPSGLREVADTRRLGGDGLQPIEQSGSSQEAVIGGGGETMGHTSSTRCEAGRFAKGGTLQGLGRRSEFERRSGGQAWWATEPRLGRVAHGVAHRVDRLKALGNGQVPQVASRAWIELSKRFYQ